MTANGIHGRLSAIVLGIHHRNSGRLETLDFSLRLLDPVLGLDSLDLAEIMVAIEKDFGVSPFEHAAPRTWADVANVVSTR